jgi:hypothetical protein
VASIALKAEHKTTKAIYSFNQEQTTMKFRTIALATAFALSSTSALAQNATGAQGGATGVPGVKPIRHLNKPPKAARLGSWGKNKPDTGPSIVNIRYERYSHKPRDFRLYSATKGNDQVRRKSPYHRGAFSDLCLRRAAAVVVLLMQISQWHT